MNPSTALTAAISSLGGSHAANPLARALAIQEGGKPDLAATLRDLGGVAAANPLARALSKMVPARTKAEKKARRNLTSQWLESHWAEIYPALVTYLGNKLRVSGTLGLIEDHVQTFLARCVERDHLAPYLGAGKPVRLSVLKVWCFHSASTELRGWGKDAAPRTTMGVRTARERDPNSEPKLCATFDTAKEVLAASETGGGFEVKDLYDPAAANAEDDLLSTERDRVVRRVLRNLRASEASPYVGLVRGLMAGRSLEDLHREFNLDAAATADFVTRFRTIVARELRA